MEQKNIIIIALVGVVLVCLAIIAGMTIFQDNTNNDTNNTNDTVNITLNDSENQTNNTTSAQTTKSKSKSKKSSSDDIPSEGTYKGVEYSLHQGEYPYYSAQNDKTYHSKKEEYNDMKDAIDSGIAD